MRKLMALVLLFAAAAANATPPAKPAARVDKRIVVSLGRKSGWMVTTTPSDGSITVAFDVLENGRGPHYDATFRLAPDGTIASYTANGHHEMGTKESETFTLKGGRATWKSEEEQGDRAVKGPAFFVPIAEIPEALGILARALLRAGKPLPLLPAGEARIVKTMEADVRANGKTRHIIGYEITGLELGPTDVWMNPDGTWFGYFSAWFSVVPEGWEPVIETIVDHQKSLAKKRDADLAAKLAHKPPAAGLAFAHARVLDVEKGAWKVDQTVLVVGDKIKSIAPSAKAKLPAGTEVVDLAGKALLPGLFDMHAHLSDEAGVLDVASGVTTARDVGNDPDRLDDWKKRFDEGSAVGPHVIRFGLIEGRNEKAASSKVTAETPEEAKAAVAEYAKRGYEGIKIYNSMRPELVPLLAREAHARKMMVTGHIPVHMLAHEAVKAGYDGIEHITMLFLNFFATHETDTRDTTRFTLVGDKAATFDLGGAPVKELTDLLKRKRTVIDPTLGAFEDMFVGEPGKVIAGMETMVARLPVQTQRAYLKNGLPDRSKAPLYKGSYGKLLTMVKLLADRKVTVVVGTDTLPGLGLHHEMALFARAGLANADVLRMATIIPARTLKLDKKTGSIAAGKTADLVVLDGDPLKDIADLAKVEKTVRAGVVYAAAPLYESVGVKP